MSVNKNIYFILNILIASFIIFFIIGIFNNYIGYKLSLYNLKHNKFLSVSNSIRPILKVKEYDLSVILKKNIFHVLDSLENINNEKLEQDIENIPVASVKDIELKGIIWTQKKQDRIAIIYNKALRSEGIYSIGDKLNGGIIEDILKEQIIINIDNKNKRIPLNNYVNLGKGIKFVNNAHYKISKELLKSKISDMGSLLRSIRVVPYISSNVKGFKVVYIQDRTIIQKLGIKKGDIILSINGNDVSNIENVMQLYRRLGNLNNIELEILRNGQRQTISYSLK